MSDERAGRNTRPSTATRRGKWQVTALVDAVRETLGAADSILDLVELADACDRLPAVSSVAVVRSLGLAGTEDGTLSDMALLVRAAAGVR